MQHMIIALGNVGKEYERTRHNAGWIVLDALYPNLVWKNNKYANADIAEYNKTLFVKPRTMMNRSGEAGIYCLTRLTDSLPLASVIVLHDDIDVPLGQVKHSFGKGDASHNGLASLSKAFASKGYHRIRIGIGRGDSKPILHEYVLGKFQSSELEIIQEISANAAKGLLEQLYQQNH